VGVKLGLSHLGKNTDLLFENRVLWQILGSERDKVTGSWRKIHTEELHKLYSSLNIERMVKSRTTKWVEHVLRMRRSERHTTF
jgi:hypothetical protein